MSRIISGTINFQNNSRRQQIGYVYKPQINNNIGLTNSKSSYYNQKSFVNNSDMDGEGFKEIFKSIYEKGKQGAKFIFNNKDAISNAYSGEIGTSIRNAIPDSDNTARPGFTGEKHAILKLKNGKYGVGNYIGPGTNLITRLERGDPPRTMVDKVAQGHDIRYGLAKTSADIRKADNIMLNKVSEISRNRIDAPQNIAQARLIKLKVIGEDLGLLRKDAFSGDLANKNIPSKDLNIMSNKLKSLEQEGFGILPGDALKLKLLKQMAKIKKKKMKGKLIGSGLNLPGSGKDNITNFVVEKIIPSIMSAVGIPKNTIPIEQLTNIISKSLDMTRKFSGNEKIQIGNLPSIIAHLTKTILPIITHAKVKSMKGKGMKGKGITDILGKHKDMLLSSLSKGLFGAFKRYIDKGAKQQGIKPPFGGGAKLKGGSFWSDFKKGFTSVFKPFAKIFAPIATAVGVPELGIPLGVVGDML